MTRLDGWFATVQGRELTRKDLGTLEDLLIGFEIDKPLNKAQRRAVQGVLATIDLALEHGIYVFHLSEAIDDHLAVAGNL